MLSSYMGGAWFGMGFWWILIVALLIAGVISFLFRRARDDSTVDSGASARDILDMRCARGEIYLNEHEEEKRHLPSSTISWRHPLMAHA